MATLYFPELDCLCIIGKVLSVYVTVILMAISLNLVCLCIIGKVLYSDVTMIQMSFFLNLTASVS